MHAGNAHGFSQSGVVYADRTGTVRANLIGKTKGGRILGRPREGGRSGFAGCSMLRVVEVAGGGSIGSIQCGLLAFKNNPLPPFRQGRTPGIPPSRRRPTWKD